MRRAPARLIAVALPSMLFETASVVAMLTRAVTTTAPTTMAIRFTSGLLYFIQSLAHQCMWRSSVNYAPALGFHDTSLRIVNYPNGW